MANFIVTGGLGVLGRAVVAELAGQGHRVAAVDIAPAPDDAGGGTVFGSVDLADEAAVGTAFGAAVAALGGLDGLVNVAGGFAWEPVEGGSLETWDAMQRINLRTALVATRTALPHLGAGGAIVNIGAAAAARPGTGMAPYAASKAGVMALTQSLAEELKARGIRVNAVLPTILDTPANRRDMPDADPAAWVQPAAAARVIAFLLSDAAGPINGAGIPLG